MGKRKIKVIFIGLLCIALCGCMNRLDSNDANSASQKFASDFSAKADIRYRETGSKIELERSGDVFFMKFCGEDELNGMNFTLNMAEKSSQVEFNGVIVPLPIGTKTPVEIVGNIFTDLKDTEKLRVWESDGCLIAAENDSDKFFVSADIDSGELISLAVPQLDLEINFNTFEYR